MRKDSSKQLIAWAYVQTGHLSQHLGQITPKLASLVRKRAGDAEEKRASKVLQTRTTYLTKLNEIIWIDVKSK